MTHLRWEKEHITIIFLIHVTKGDAIDPNRDSCPATASAYLCAKKTGSKHATRKNYDATPHTRINVFKEIPLSHSVKQNVPTMIVEGVGVSENVTSIGDTSTSFSNSLMGSLGKGLLQKCWRGYPCRASR